jgi:D-glycero-D-manno-heptose 1,7-bisphosphate phosphatase
MTTLVCSDRDGTINKDENYYLGSSPDWKNQIEILPGVVEGIKIINSLPDHEMFIATNQSGVALGKINTSKMREVNQYIVNLLEEQGAKISGYIACPYVTSAYAEKKKALGEKINNIWIQDSNPDIKPNPGMIATAASRIGKTLEECVVYVIGDRVSDIQTAINAEGIGILIPSSKTNELNDEKKMFELKLEHPSRIYTFKNFLDAAKYIEIKHCIQQ